jgi:hypothetical protein
MPLQRVPKLVVAEIQCRRGCALIESVTTQSILEDLPLIFGDGTTEVLGSRD